MSAFARNIRSADPRSRAVGLWCEAVLLVNALLSRGAPEPVVSRAWRRETRRRTRYLNLSAAAIADAQDAR